MSIQDIVDASGTERWKVYLSHTITNADVLSRYINYNKHCHTATRLTAPELGRLADDSEQELLVKNAPIAQLKSVLPPCNLFQTEVGSESSDRKDRMFKRMST